MRKLILRIALPVLMLAFVPHTHAQDVIKPDFKMSCQEVLKLGLEKFTEVYGEKTQDYSNAGQKAVVEYYVNCKRPLTTSLPLRFFQRNTKSGLTRRLANNWTTPAIG